MGDARAVCVCGSSPGPAADRLYGRFIELGRARGALTLLDTYGKDYEDELVVEGGKTNG